MGSVLNKILAYLGLRRLYNKGEKKNLNLRFMHGINRISILLFLFCVLVMLYRFIWG